MLTKKDKKKRYNKKAKTSSTHVFDAWGDRYDSKFMQNSANTAQKAFSGSNLGGSIAGIAGGIGNIVEAGIANAQIADTTEQEQEIEARENWQSSAYDTNSLLAEMSSDVSLNENNSWKSIRGVTPGQMVGNTLKGAMSGASAGAQVGGPFGAIAGAAAGLAGGLAGIFAGNSKARKKAGELNEAAKKANLAKAQTLTAKAGALDQAADARSLAAYYAEGGQINPFPSSDFGSPITEFNAGGSHEENPYDGIPQGVAPDGLPNLVEEGEVKYDNYIFSDRLMLNKNDKKKYKFLKGKTYADAAKAIKKELGIDERPNDLIAKADLEEHLNILSTLQEEERAKRGLRGENRMMYKNGGHLFKGTKSFTPQTPLLQEYSFDYTGDKFSDDYYSQDPITNLVFYGDGLKPPQILNKEIKIEPVKSTDLDFRNAPRPYRKSSNSSFDSSSFLQAAPAIGSAIGTIASLFDKPTYKHTKRLTQSEKPVTPITYTPTHQDIRLDRFDTNYHANKLAAQAGATRRAIREQTSSNPYASTAALLSADANAQSQMGDLYRKAAEHNQGLALQEAQFNSAGRRADAEGLLKAASANATLQDKALSRQAEKDIYAARLNLAEDQAWDTANSANMTSLFDNLGAMGKEKISTSLGLINNLLEAGQVEAAEQLAQNIFGNEFTLSRSAIPTKKSSDSKKSYGGKIKTKRKKGYTI